MENCVMATKDKTFLNLGSFQQDMFFEQFTGIVVNDYDFCGIVSINPK